MTTGEQFFLMFNSFLVLEHNKSSYRTSDGPIIIFRELFYNLMVCTIMGNWTVTVNTRKEDPFILPVWRYGCCTLIDI